LSCSGRTLACHCFITKQIRMKNRPKRRNKTHRRNRGHARRAQRQHQEETLDDALKNTFPASDAVSIVQPVPPAADVDSVNTSNRSTTQPMGGPSSLIRGWLAPSPEHNQTVTSGS
jgi:hypothetical protein